MAVIDIGTPVVADGGRWAANNTAMVTAIPADGTGILESVDIRFNTNGSGSKVGTFFANTTKYDCRDAVSIGAVTAGSTQTFSGLSIDVVIGDLLGEVHSGGDIARDGGGGADDIKYLAGDYVTIGSSETYALISSQDIKIRGTGITVAAAGAPNQAVIIA